MWVFLPSSFLACLLQIRKATKDDPPLLARASWEEGSCSRFNQRLPGREACPDVAAQTSLDDVERRGLHIGRNAVDCHKSALKRGRSSEVCSLLDCSLLPRLCGLA